MNPFVNPILKEPCVMINDNGNDVFSSNSPLTIWKSGDKFLRNSKIDGDDVAFPRHKTCDILPGTSSFLN